MKTERYIVEIEMPDGDGASPLWLRDVLQSDANIEDEGRWKVLVDNYWKPSDKELAAMLTAIGDERQKGSDVVKELQNIYQQLKKLREE